MFSQENSTLNSGKPRTRLKPSHVAYSSLTPVQALPRETPVYFQQRTHVQLRKAWGQQVQAIEWLAITKTRVLFPSVTVSPTSNCKLPRELYSSASNTTTARRPYTPEPQNSRQVPEATAEVQSHKNAWFTKPSNPEFASTITNQYVPPKSYHSYHRDPSKRY